MGEQEPDLFNEAASGVLLLLLWVAGALAMLPVTASLVHLWQEDPLRSFGILIPFASIFLIVRAWRSARWSWKGTLWGVLPIVLAIVLARLLGDGLVTYRFRDHAVGLLQPGLFYFTYGSGVLLLIGGKVLWRASFFPLLLLFCVNPIPHLFNQVIDLPLQSASADTARAFAHALGLHPSGEQLQMLFAPRFGMIIVPGCNGIRGSVTMGYLMLLLGYWRGYRPLRLTAYVAAAVALGYLLNLLRLCVLVLYYWAGLHLPLLRPHGEGIDYLIGGTLFLLVTTLAGWLLLRGGTPGWPAQREPHLPWNRLFSSRRLKVAAALMLLSALPELPSAFARMRAGGENFTSAEEAMRALPKSAGQWQRGRFSFEQQEADGRIIWVWAPFTRKDGRVVELGVWLSPLQHYALNSRRIHGVSPTWTGTLQASAVGGEPVRLSAFTMADDLSSDGAVPTLFAETTCWAERCSDASIAGFGKQGFSLAIAPVSARSQQRLSLLMRAPENVREAAETGRQGSEEAVVDLLRQLDLKALTHQLGTR